MFKRYQYIPLNAACAVLNALTLSVFVGFAVWYVASYFLGATDGLSWIFSIGGFLFSPIVELVKLWKRHVRKPDLACARLYEFEKPIDRADNLLRLEEYIAGNTGKLHIVTGESGCGKTSLISRFCEEANEAQDGCAQHQVGKYYRLPDFERLNTCRWVFFDQFEQALRSDVAAEVVKGVETLSAKTNVVVSLRKDRLGDLCSMLTADYARPFFLENSAVEFEDVERCFEDMAEESSGFAVDEECLKLLERDFAGNRLTYIQLRLLLTTAKARGGLGFLSGYAVAGRQGSFVDYDAMATEFLRDSLCKMRQQLDAASVLYLLSLDDATGVSYGMGDFQNVALCSQATAEDVVGALSSFGWIRAINKEGPADGEPSVKYEMSHDYFRRIFHDVCTEVLDSQVRKNIDFYHMQHSRRANEVERSYSNGIRSAFNRFFGGKENPGERKSKAGSLANVLLVLLLVGFSAINVCILLDGSRQCNLRSIELALIQIMLLGSVYYVYNYFIRFLCLLGIRGVAVLVLGLVLCGACLIDVSHWGLWLGVEVILVGVVLGSVKAPMQTFDGEFFLHRAKVNISTGAAIAFLGCALFPKVQCDALSMIALFALYGLFIAFCVLSHINEGCLKAHVGKVLFSIGANVA